MKDRVRLAGSLQPHLNFLRICVLLAGGVLTAPSAAQSNAAALQPLFDEALAHNPMILAQRMAWQEARTRIHPAGSLPDPMVGVKLMRDSTRLDDYSELEYMASQEFPWFGTRKALRDVKRLEAEAEGFLYLEQIRQTREQVTAAAWSLGLARQALAINAEHINWLTTLHDSAQARYASGVGGQSDLLRARIALARERKLTGDLEQDEALALTELNRQLGRPPQTPRPIGDLADPPALTRPLDDYLARARDFCCTLQAFEKRVMAQRIMVTAVKKESAPMFQAFVEARQMNGESGIQAIDTGVAMSLPWGQHRKYRDRETEARSALARSEADLESEILMTQMETHAAYTEALKAQRERALIETDVLVQIDQLIASSLAAYENGEMPLFELIDAERMRRDAQLEHARARTAFARAHATLDTLTGPYLQPELDTGLVTEANNPPWEHEEKQTEPEPITP